MIGRVTLNVDGADHPLRLSTKAMVRLEEKNDGKSITEILASIQDNPGITFFAEFFAVVMNDGNGDDLDTAMELMDQAGGVFAVADTINKVIEEAFPKVEETPNSKAKASVEKTKPVRKK